MKRCADELILRAPRRAVDHIVEGLDKWRLIEDAHPPPDGGLSCSSNVIYETKSRSDRKPQRELNPPEGPVRITYVDK